MNGSVGNAVIQSPRAAGPTRHCSFPQEALCGTQALRSLEDNSRMGWTDPFCSLWAAQTELVSVKWSLSQPTPAFCAYVGAGAACSLPSGISPGPLVEKAAGGRCAQQHQPLAAPTTACQAHSPCPAARHSQHSKTEAAKHTKVTRPSPQRAR